MRARDVARRPVLLLAALLACSGATAASSKGEASEVTKSDAAPTPTSLEMGLHQAVALALRRSPDLEAAALRKGAQQTAALAPWSRFIPRLALDVGALRRTDPLAGPSYSFFQQDATLTSQAITNGLSLSGTLPIGTTYSVGVGQRVAYYSSLAEALNPRLEPALTARISQPLWRGLWPSVNLAPFDVAAARVDVADAEQRALADSVAIEVANAWIDVAAAAATLELRGESLALAQRFERVTRQLIEGGELSRLDLALATQTVSQRQLELEDARRALDDAQDRFAALLFVEPGEPVPVGTLPTHPPSPLTLDDAVAVASAHSPRLALLAGRIAELAVEADRLEDAVWPDIRLGVEGELRGLSGQSTCVGGYLADGLTPCGVHPIYQGGYDRALKNMADARFYAVGVTVSGSLPVWTGPDAADGRARREQANAVRAEERAELLRLRHRVRRLLENQVRVRKVHDASLAAVKLSQAALDAQDTKLRAGRSTSFDLVRAQELLIAAQVQEIEARAQLARTVVELEGTTGELVRRAMGEGDAAAP